MLLKFIFILLATAFSSVANSATVTYQFTGTVTFTSGFDRPFDGLIDAGQSFTGEIVLDTASSPTSGSGNDVSYYGAVTRYRVDFGSLYAEFDLGGVRLIDNVPNVIFDPLTGEEATSYRDSMVLNARTDLSAYPTNTNTNIEPTGYELEQIYMAFSDPLGEMINSSNLSTNAPDISGLSYRPFFLDYHLIGSSTGEARVNGRIDTLTSVPVPAAVWLLGSGLLVLIGFAKSKK